MLYAWWQRHVCKQLPQGNDLDNGTARRRAGELSEVASPMPYTLHHQATYNMHHTILRLYVMTYFVLSGRRMLQLDNTVFHLRDEFRFGVA